MRAHWLAREAEMENPWLPVRDPVLKGKKIKTLWCEPLAFAWPHECKHKYAHTHIISETINLGLTLLSFVHRTISWGEKLEWKLNDDLTLYNNKVVYHLLYIRSFSKDFHGNGCVSPQIQSTSLDWTLTQINTLFWGTGVRCLGISSFSGLVENGHNSEALKTHF